MNVKELKKSIKNLSDNTEIFSHQAFDGCYSSKIKIGTINHHSKNNSIIFYPDFNGKYISDDYFKEKKKKKKK